MDKKIIILISIFIFLINLPLVSSENELAVAVMPLLNGSIQKNTNFQYEINFTTDVACTNVVKNVFVNATTNANGLAVIYLNISQMSGKALYICEYRDGSATPRKHNISSLLADYITGYNEVNTTLLNVSKSAYISNLYGDSGGDLNLFSDILFKAGASVNNATWVNTTNLNVSDNAYINQLGQSLDAGGFSIFNSLWGNFTNINISQNAYFNKIGSDFNMMGNNIINTSEIYTEYLNITKMAQMQFINSSSTLVIRLGDAAGINNLIVQASDGSAKFTVNSLGVGVFDGDVNVGGHDIYGGINWGDDFRVCANRNQMTPCLNLWGGEYAEINSSLEVIGDINTSETVRLANLSIKSDAKCRIAPIGISPNCKSVCPIDFGIAEVRGCLFGFNNTVPNLFNCTATLSTHCLCC